MSVIVLLKRGTSGKLNAITDTGSSFIFKEYFLQPSCAKSLYELPADVDDESLLEAVNSTLAETAALSLIARAEQHTAGLEAKLSIKKHSKPAIRAAINHLVDCDIVCDTRYAKSWIMQRLRSRIEGPKTLYMALRRRSVNNIAIKTAIDELLTCTSKQATRVSIIQAQIKKLNPNNYDGVLDKNLHAKLKSLGWSSADIEMATDTF